MFLFHFLGSLCSMTHWQGWKKGRPLPHGYQQSGNIPYEMRPKTYTSPALTSVPSFFQTYSASLTCYRCHPDHDFKVSLAQSSISLTLLVENIDQQCVILLKKKEKKNQSPLILKWFFFFFNINCSKFQASQMTLVVKSLPANAGD